MRDDTKNGCVADYVDTNPVVSHILLHESTAFRRRETIKSAPQNLIFLKPLKALSTRIAGKY